MLSPEEWSALYLSAKVAICATLFCLPFAIALAWVLARHDFYCKFLVEALLQLPMVLPPCGAGLYVADCIWCKWLGWATASALGDSVGL